MKNATELTMGNIIHILSLEDGHGYKNGLFKKWVCKECNKWSAGFKVNNIAGKITEC